MSFLRFHVRSVVAAIVCVVCAVADGRRSRGRSIDNFSSSASASRRPLGQPLLTKLESLANTQLTALQALALLFLAGSSPAVYFLPGIGIRRSAVLSKLKAGRAAPVSLSDGMEDLPESNQLDRSHQFDPAMLTTSPVSASPSGLRRVATSRIGRYFRLHGARDRLTRADAVSMALTDVDLADRLKARKAAADRWKGSTVVAAVDNKRKGKGMFRFGFFKLSRSKDKANVTADGADLGKRRFFRWFSKRRKSKAKVDPETMFRTNMSSREVNIIEQMMHDIMPQEDGASERPPQWIEEIATAIPKWISSKGTSLVQGRQFKSQCAKAVIEKVDVRHLDPQDIREVERSSSKIVFDIGDMELSVRVFFSELSVFNVPVLLNKVLHLDSYIDVRIAGGVRAGYEKSAAGIWEPFCQFWDTDQPGLPPALLVHISFSLNRPLNKLDKLRFIFVPIAKKILRFLINKGLVYVRYKMSGVFQQHENFQIVQDMIAKGSFSHER